MRKPNRERLIAELQTTLAEVKVLKGFIPICASCKQIRDDQGFWDRDRELHHAAQRRPLQPWHLPGLHEEAVPEM